MGMEILGVKGGILGMERYLGRNRNLREWEWNGMEVQ